MTAAMTMERCLSELGADPDLLDERRREELSSKGFALFTGIINVAQLLRTRFEGSPPRRASAPVWRCIRKRAPGGWPTW